MVIRRDFYLEKLIQRKGNGLIKVITGIRSLLLLSYSFYPIYSGMKSGTYGQGKGKIV